MTPGKRIIVTLLILLALLNFPASAQLEFNPSVNLENADQPLCQIPLLNLLINECFQSSAGAQGPPGPAGENGTSAGTITSNLSMENFNINNLADPSDPQDAVTKHYFDTRIPIVFHADNNSVNQLTSLGGAQVKYTHETIDTGDYYNTTTSTFMPLVEGYYYIHSVFAPQGMSSTSKSPSNAIYKNGVPVALYQRSYNAANIFTLQCSVVVYLDGVDDYVSVYFVHSDATKIIEGNPIYTYFEGYKL